MKPAPVSLPVVTRALAAVVLEEAMDSVQGLAVAGAAPLLKAAVLITAVATTAAAHAPPTLGSLGRTLVMVQVIAQVVTPVTAAPHAVSVVRKARAHHATTLTNASHVSRVTKYSARTHAARALTWASSATISTSVSLPAMCQQAFHHPVCLHAAAVVAGVVIAAVAVAVVAATLVEAARALAAVAAVVVEATRVVDFGADSAAL